MPQLCTVCTSPQRSTLETLVASKTRTAKEAARGLGLGYESVKRHLRRHVGNVPTATVAMATPGDPVATFRAAFAQEPMAHQVEYLSEIRPLVFLKGRQVGATQAAAALAIHVAREAAGNTVAVISPSLRQSTEVTARARVGLWSLGETLVQDSTSLLRTANGSRILSLPGKARGIRGYACQLVILDEAAWIDDETFTAARALVAATGGRIVAQSTPALPSGWFYDLWTDGGEGWARLKVRSDEVPTIDPEFLARERAEMAPALYAAEYEGEFQTAAVLGRWFDEAGFDARVDDRFSAIPVPPDLNLEV